MGVRDSGRSEHCCRSSPGYLLPSPVRISELIKKEELGSLKKEQLFPMHRTKYSGCYSSLLSPSYALRRIKKTALIKIPRNNMLLP